MTDIPCKLCAPPTIGRDGRDGYDRARDLPGLVALWPAEMADGSLAGRLRLLARLRTALRRERQRGLAGHWAYDLARHARLLEAYRREAAALVATQQHPGGADQPR